MDTQQQVFKGMLFKSIKLITNRRSTANIMDAFVYYKNASPFHSLTTL